MADMQIQSMREQEVIAEGVSFEDFLERYEGQRVEWHAGKVIKQVTNNEKHQFILGFLFNVFSHFLGMQDIGRVYLAGYQMFISHGVPARQPDLMIVLKENYDRIKPKQFEGPADICLEVVSPGSSHIDRGAKLDEYEAAGVPEYWLIDPIREEAVIYTLADDKHYRRRPFDDQGRLTSTILPGFALDPAILWQETLPTGPQLVQMVEAMLSES